MVFIGILILGVVKGICFEVFVFYPGIHKGAQLEAKLGEKFEKVQVFDKPNVFLREVKKSKNNVIVAPHVFFEHYLGWDVKRKGMNKNFPTENYYLVSLNESVRLDNLHEKRVGIWNQIGRSKSEQYLKQLFGISPKKIKNVNRKEDLYTLLGIDMVDAIVVPELLLKKIQAESKAELLIIAQSKTIFAHLGVGVQGNVSNWEKPFGSLENQVWQEMDVDLWTEVKP